MPSDWQTVKARDVFTFQAPPDAVQMPVRPIDSYVEVFESKTLKIQFDYGWYSSKLKDIGTKQQWVVIDGRSALVAYNGTTLHVHFPSKTLSSLTFSVTAPKDMATAEAIIRSIHFLKADN